MYFCEGKFSHKIHETFGLYDVILLIPASKVDFGLSEYHLSV